MRQNERGRQFRGGETGAASADRNTCGWPHFGLPAVLRLRPRQPETVSVLRFLGAPASPAGSAADAALVSAAARMAEQVAQRAVPRAVRLFLSGSDFERCAGLPAQRIWPDFKPATGAVPGRGRDTGPESDPVPSDGVVLYALTLGAPLDAWLRACQVASLPDAVVADAAATALLFEFEQAVRRQILSEIEPAGLVLSSPVFPGDGLLPLSAQPMICRWLDTHRKMAMGVRPDLQVMEPAKSLTAAARVGRRDCDGMTAPLPGHDCRCCPMSASCPYAAARSDAMPKGEVAPD